MGEFKQYCNYKDFCRKLEGVCRKIPEAAFATIGRQGDYDIFQLKVNRNLDSHLWISAGFHGDEPAGPLGVVKFLKELDVHGLKHNLAIYPMANPHGFERDVRRNYRRQDLNRHFGPKMNDDAMDFWRPIRDELKEIKLFCSLHEWPGSKKFFIYSSGDVSDELDQKILKVAGNHFPLKQEAVVKLKKLDGDNSLDDNMIRHHVPCVTVETPGTAPLSRRVACVAEILTFLAEDSLN